MVDTPISGLPDGGSVQTTDQIPVTRGTSNFRVVTGALAPLDNVTTARIDDNAVTFAKMQDIATATFMGRDTAGTGDPEALTATEARTLLNVEDGAAADQSAAEVPFTPAGGVSATDVQAAIVEVEADYIAADATVKAGAPLISTEDELVGQMELAVVATLPGTPDANTVYFVTT